MVSVWLNSVRLVYGGHVVNNSIRKLYWTHGSFLLLFFFFTSTSLEFSWKALVTTTNYRKTTPVSAMQKFTYRISELT